MGSAVAVSYTHLDVYKRQDVASAGERVANGAADTGSGTAKGLNFRWVVVRLIFKQQQPWLHFTVNRDVNFHRASVDFFRRIQTVKFSGFAQALGRNCTQIHQAYRFCPAQILSLIHI